MVCLLDGSVFIFTQTDPVDRNVKQFQVTYPDIEGDVGMAKNAIQPIYLFCASRAKLRVSCTGSKEGVFDSAVEDAKAGNKEISILGFTFGRTASTTGNDVTHASDLVKRHGWYEIEPTLVAGSCVVLAVLGSKLDRPEPASYEQLFGPTDDRP